MTNSRDPRLTPVIAFDVDGVLRVQKLEQVENQPLFIQQDLFSSEITMNKDEYPDIYHGKPTWDENGQAKGANHFSKAGAQLIQAVAHGSIQADAVWATTWQKWANTYFASLLGIPELPVAVQTLQPLDANWFQGGSPAWKAFQLARQFNGRPLIWLDDNLPKMEAEKLVTQRREIDKPLTLSYQVNPYTGITLEDIAAITEWLELVSTSEGQYELRDKYRADQAKERARVREIELKLKREAEIAQHTRKLMEELFPGKDYFIRDVTSMAKHREGLTAENIGYSMKRHTVQGDPEELSKRLRIDGYHFETAQGYDDEK